MKNQSIVVGLALLISTLMPNHLFAQTTATQPVNMAVTGVALIRVMKGSDPAAGVTLTLGGPLEAGLEVKPISEDLSTRLRISSLASDTTVSGGRKITAQITTGSMTGSRTMLELALEAPGEANANNFVNYSPDGGVLAGALQNLGDHAGNKPAITLVTNIYTCWSGTNPDDGYIIHYRYSKPITTGTATPRSVVITYTIVGQ